MLFADMQGIISNLWSNLTGGWWIYVVCVVVTIFLVARGQGKTFMEVLRDAWAGISGGPDPAQDKLDEILKRLKEVEDEKAK